MSKQDIVEFIRGRYAAVHQAAAPVTYGDFVHRMRQPGRGAALGFRRADSGPLFLEKYLDLPVEQALVPHLGPGIERSRIVELGSLAGNSGLALIGVWLDAARQLRGAGDIGVAVLTAPLRAMLARLGIRLHDLAPADPRRIGASAGLWGRYYDNDPRVCAGSLPEGLRQLERFTARRRLRVAVA